MMTPTLSGLSDIHGDVC